MRWDVHRYINSIFFTFYGTYPARTLSYASDRVLVRLNTGALLKRATLERKKYAGGESHERSTSSNHTSLTLVLLGRFPIRPVSQSAASYGLASWTGQYLLTCSTRVRFGVSYHRRLFTVNSLKKDTEIFMSSQIPLIWIVSDSISAFVAPSDSVRFWIFLWAWMTVEWSLLKKPPMVGHETSVISWQRYMAIWRG